MHSLDPSLPQPPRTPLGLAQHAGSHATAATWLAAGVSGQGVPGRLVSGLRVLPCPNELLVENPEEMPQELALKSRCEGGRARNSGGPVPRRGAMTLSA
jgi:hypothetical protein